MLFDEPEREHGGALDQVADTIAGVLGKAASLLGVQIAYAGKKQIAMRLVSASTTA